MTSHRILVVSGSTRRASVHSLIARTVAAELERQGRDHLLVDLAEFDLPLYQGDLEAEHGVPAAAHRLAELLQSSGGLLVATPEYNGAVGPLLKNTVDWITRVDIGVLRDTFIGLIAASPGRGGAVRGLAMVRTWFEAMRLTLADTDLSMPRIRDSIVEHDAGTGGRADGTVPSMFLDPAATATVAEFVGSFLRQFDEYCTGRPSD